QTAEVGQAKLPNSPARSPCPPHTQPLPAASSNPHAPPGTGSGPQKMTSSPPPPPAITRSANTAPRADSSAKETPSGLAKHTAAAPPAPSPVSTRTPQAHPAASSPAATPPAPAAPGPSSSEAGGCRACLPSSRRNDC